MLGKQYRITGNSKRKTKKALSFFFFFFNRYWPRQVSSILLLLLFLPAIVGTQSILLSIVVLVLVATLDYLLPQHRHRHVRIRVLLHHLCYCHFEIFLSDMNPSFPQGKHPRFCTNPFAFSTTCIVHFFCNFD